MRIIFTLLGFFALSVLILGWFVLDEDKPRWNNRPSQTKQIKVPAKVVEKPSIKDHQIIRSSYEQSSGSVFFTNEKGLWIIDKNGNQIWHKPSLDRVENLQAQVYLQKPVLTYWSASEGYVILNQNYKKIWNMTIPKSAGESFHIYDHFAYTLQRVQKGNFLDTVVIKVDIRTKKIVWRWQASKYIVRYQTYMKASDRPVWDPFAINSIDVTGDGTLLISAANMHALYLIREKNNKIVWQMGGKKSTLKMQSGSQFMWQRSAQWIDQDRIILLDNGATQGIQDTKDQYRRAYYSRGIVVRISGKSVELAKEYIDEQRILVEDRGSILATKTGSVIINWGTYTTEFSTSQVPVWQISDEAEQYEWTAKTESSPAHESTTFAQDHIKRAIKSSL